MKKVYELVVDLDEIYRSIGIFESVADAVRIAMETRPQAFDGDAMGEINLEVRSRKFGSFDPVDIAVVVARVSLVDTYVEEDEGYSWEKKVHYEKHLLPWAWIDPETGEAPQSEWPKWRWTGTHYEEHRGYPLGHCALQFKKELA